MPTIKTQKINNNNEIINKDKNIPTIKKCQL